MIYNKHLEIKGQHAFLGASQYHWINYDEEKLKEAYKSYIAKERGTRLHEIASDLINERIELPNKKNTFNLFVNDAIALKMQSEQPLYYSENCFGTADALIFENDLLRIHDLKTGKTKASFTQLKIYAALFCLEYDFNPWEIDIELRIYQSNKVTVLTPEDDDICYIIDKIITFDPIIDQIKKEENYHGK